MKIQFITQYPDPYNPARVYQPGWVAEFTEPDAQAAISAGAAEPAPPDAMCRKYASAALVTSECVPTGEHITLAELKQNKEPVKTGLKKVVFGID